MKIQIIKNRKSIIAVMLIIMAILCFFARDAISFQFSLNKAFYYSEHEEYEEYENAIAEYDSLIAQKPDLYELYVNKAIMQANAGRYDEAIATFSYAETLNDNDPELYYNMAYLYDMVGNTDMYEQCLNKGTALEFENSLKGED